MEGLSEVIDRLKYLLFAQEWAAENHRVRRVDRLERDRS
jgi:hypothetical protein